MAVRTVKSSDKSSVLQDEKSMVHMCLFDAIKQNLQEKALIKKKDSLVNLPGTLSRWVWPVLPWRPAPESRRLSGRQGLCVVVMGEGPDSEAPRLCESRPLIGRPSC